MANVPGLDQRLIAAAQANRETKLGYELGYHKNKPDDNVPRDAASNAESRVRDTLAVMWKELGAATLHSSCRAIASSAECLKPFIASCSGKREHKRLERAWTKKRNHYEEQKILREYHELKEECSQARLGKLVRAEEDADAGEDFEAMMERMGWSQCYCSMCAKFKKVMPLGPPLLSSLVELSEANSGAETERQGLLGRFENPVDTGREIDWHANSPRELLPAAEDISIGAFLIRKMDGKRLELTADSRLKALRKYHPEYGAQGGYDGYGDSSFESQVSTKGLSMEFKAQLKTQIMWKDVAELEAPPEGLTADEREEWAAHNRHVPSLAISAMSISLRQRSCGCNYNNNESCLSCTSESRPRLVDVDSLLAMLRSETLEGRWM